jgi:hypothetical protein
MPASARAVRSAWVSGWLVFLVAGWGWGIDKNLLVTSKFIRWIDYVNLKTVS